MTANTTVKIREGQVLHGPQFPEPMYVVKVSPWGPEAYMLGLAGKHTWRFRKVILSAAEIETLTIEEGEEEA